MNARPLKTGRDLLKALTTRMNRDTRELVFSVKIEGLIDPRDVKGGGTVNIFVNGMETPFSREGR